MREREREGGEVERKIERDREGGEEKYLPIIDWRSAPAPALAVAPTSAPASASLAFFVILHYVSPLSWHLLGPTLLIHFVAYLQIFRKVKIQKDLTRLLFS